MQEIQSRSKEREYGRLDLENLIENMKTKFLLTSCLLCFTAGAFAQQGTLTLKIEGIDAKKRGQLLVGVFDEKNFLKVGKQLYELEVDVNAGQMEITMENIAAGTYAVSVFQDIDRNKELETNFIGIPKEPIGFSNDARIKFGPPSFSDAQFKVERDKNIVLKIILR
jgi:uncharacterized protein (DUF2141 family)